MNREVVERRAGRPRAIPEALIPEVVRLYRGGLGYRAVARKLREEGILVDWSTIRRIIKNRHAESRPDEKAARNGS